MFYWTIFVCFLGFVLAKSDEQGPMKITFKIKINDTKMMCDHNFDDMQNNIYTVLEEEEFTMIIDYNKIFINYLLCREHNNNNNNFEDENKKNGNKNNVSFKVQKTMGALWNCTVLAHRNNPTVLPVVHYDNAKFSAAYCFMQIHVRQKTPPQTILVNNMELQAARTDLSEKDVDFTAEYQYADGDVVNVICANFLNQALPLTMDYAMAGTKSDNSTMKELLSHKAIGFRAKLHSGHNNSYMTCTNKESTDYTKLKLTFIMRTELNIVSIKINGMILRPKLKLPPNHYYEIKYKYATNELITVVCEVQRPDMKLVVVKGSNSVSRLSSYKKKELIEGKAATMSFHLKPTDDNKLVCASDSTSGASTEQVDIRFTERKLPIDIDPLHLKLWPSNGTVMELYNAENKLKVIYYEFDDDETLQLKCGPLVLTPPGPVQYLQFKDSEICRTNGCAVYKTTTISSKDENSEMACYMKEQHDEVAPSKDDKVLSEIRVILRKRVLTTTSTTTTTTTTTTSTALPPKDANISPATNLSGASSEPREKGDDTGLRWAVVGGAVLCIIIICISTVIVKLRKRNHSQGGPHNRNYKNLQSPSETSIPTSPPQWESNYAVPVDRRAEDTTYSVPCQGPALYSTPTPKNLRNKKQKPDNPTYAVLEVANAQGRKNIFKETDDPNYSEVYANRQEQCYAKVLPKSVRNKMAQDNNPYSYVTNEPAYANSAEPEPMYCEPAKPQDGTYANLNNSHYANSNAQEYVEPTYCEPQKRMK